MKVESYIFAVLTVFFAIATTAYWLLAREPAGTVALALTGGLVGLIGYYLLFTSRHIPPRPEDRPDADISEGAGELGFFSPHSWWPLFVAAAAAIFALGAAFWQYWLMLLGAFVLVLAVTGFLFEYYRGETHFH
ncbi:MAG: cytochrome c oxidase subunit 4 [Nocardioidaceae bacterium]